ncbi:MAG: ABC transporter permease [Nanoarchaeota archaeon]
MIRDYLQVAMQSLMHRRLRSWLTMIGIFIGIAAVVSLISLGQGMQYAIENQFFQLGADKLTIQTKGVATGPPGSNSGVTLGKGDLQVVRRATGVKVATGRLIESISVKFNDKTRFLYLASLPQDSAERAMVTQVANVEEGDIAYGRSLRPDDQRKVIMSVDYYNDPKFGGKALRVGDKILVNDQPVDVVGFFKKTGNPFVDMSFVMNEEPLRKLLNIPDRIGLIVAQVEPGADMDVVAQAVEKDLRRYRGVKEGKEDFEVRSAKETLDTFKTVLNIVTAVLIGIASISLIVGGIGIMNTMYTSVLERTKEIGIMKAIGATNRDILLIFLFESGLLGMAGGAIGIAIGIGLSKAVEVIARAQLGTSLIQAHFPLYLVLGSLAFSFGIGTLAGVLPARQAANLQPVQALRSTK